MGWDGCFFFTSQVCSMWNNLFRSPLHLWLPDAFEPPWGLVQRDGEWFRNVNLKTKPTNKVQLLTPILIQWRHSVKGAKQVALKKMAWCNIHPAATIRWAMISSLNNTTVREVMLNSLSYSSCHCKPKSQFSPKTAENLEHMCLLVEKLPF